VSEIDYAAAAQTLWQARTDGRLLDGLPESQRPTDLGDAYRIQDETDPLAGRRVGWKLAATGAGGRTALGVDQPLAGPLYDRFEIGAGGTLAFASVRMQTVEAEFGLELGADLPAEGAPYDHDTVLGALGAFVPAIEVPNTRYGDHRSVGGALLTADLACGGWYVLGERIADFDYASLPGRSVTLTTANGEASGTGEKVLGDPVQAVRWLANELAGHGRSLKVGDVVITGAAAAVREPGSGDAVADFGDLGTLTLRLT
jgi:2-keto-4-pentenoate hydratase